MRRTLLGLTAVLLFPACAAAPVKPVGDDALFAFHDSFWLNLHQLLLAEGRPRRRPVPQPAHDEPQWVEAIAFYARDYSQRFFLDDELARINLVLASERGETLSAAVSPELRGVLEKVAPLFRLAEWPEDQRRSAQWVASVRGLLVSSGAGFAADLARVFGSPWPDRPIQVETSKQAGPFGAFSLGAPLVITISTADPSYQGEAALEMLFHEASHGLDAPIVAALERECARLAVPVPESLDHAILFFSTGELARKYLSKGYEPYGYKNGLYVRSRVWAMYEVALRAHWLPFLEGRVTLEAAMAALVKRVAAGER